MRIASTKESGKNRESRVGNELARAMQGLGILMWDGQHESEVAVPAESNEEKGTETERQDSQQALHDGTALA